MRAEEVIAVLDALDGARVNWLRQALAGLASTGEVRGGWARPPQASSLQAGGREAEPEQLRTVT